MISKSTNDYVNGFSLIEIIVAFTILSATFIAMASSFPFGLMINKRAEDNSIASYLAQNKIEELISGGYDNIALGIIEAKHRLSSDTADYLYYYQRETIVNYVDSNLTATSTDVGLKKISTNVYYTNAVSKTENIHNISTLISQR
ncbi:prepilin-type N-terminal cleavage/methylation domain-containing protein [Candidatus Falkowbacteria bacterium]|nr:prepilin-type N-terminal cleavage/methylation domain-containing protein [Candidatus Falkowbacteria bacterium]